MNKSYKFYMNEFEVVAKNKPHKPKQTRTQISSAEKDRSDLIKNNSRKKAMDKQLSCSKNSPFKQNETGNGGYPGDLKRTSVSQRKQEGKRIKRFIGLINHMIDSANQMVKYVNVNHYDGELAVKLFKSDQSNVLYELDGLNLSRLFEQRPLKSSGKKTIKEKNEGSDTKNLNKGKQASLLQQQKALKRQNLALKKQLIAIDQQCRQLEEDKIQLNLELKHFKQNEPLSNRSRKQKSKESQKQIENLIRQIYQLQNSKKQFRMQERELKHHLHLRGKEVQKLSGLLKSTMQSQDIMKYIENIQKSTSLSMLIFDTTKHIDHDKRVELEKLIANLQKHRQQLYNQISYEFQEREEVIQLLIQKAPQLLGKTIPQADLAQVSVTQLLQLLLSQSPQSNKDQQNLLIEYQQKIEQLNIENKNLNKWKSERLQEEIAASTTNKDKTLVQEKVQKLQNSLRELCITVDVPIKEIAKMDQTQMVESVKGTYIKNKKLVFQHQSKIEKLEAKISKQQGYRQQQIRQLKNHIDNLEQQNQQLSKQKFQSSESKKNSAAHQTTIKSLEAKIRVYQSKITSLEESSQQNAELKQQCSKLKSKVESLNEQIIRQRAKVDELKERNKLLQKPIMLTGASEESEQVIELKQRVKYQQEEKRLIEDEFKSYKEIVEANMEQSLKNSQGEIESLKTISAQLNEKLKLKQNQLLSKNKLLEKYQEELITLKTQEQDNDVSNYAEKLQSQLQYKEAQIVTLQLGHRRSIEESRSYEEKFRDEEKKVDILLSEINEKSKELESLQEYLGTKTEEIRGYLSDAEANRERIEDLKEQNRLIKDYTEALEAENAKLKQKVEDGKLEVDRKKQADRSLNNQKIRQLSSQIQEFQHNLQILNTMLIQKQEQIKDKQQIIKRLSKTKQDQLSQELGDKAMLVEETLAKYQSVCDELETNKRQVQQLRERETELNLELTDRLTKILSLQESLSESNRKQQILKGEMENVNNGYRTLKDEQASTTKELVESKNQKGELEVKLEEAKKQIESLKLKSIGDNESQELNDKTGRGDADKDIAQKESKINNLLLMNTVLLEENQRLHKIIQETEYSPVKSLLKEEKEALKSQVKELEYSVIGLKIQVQEEKEKTQDVLRSKSQLEHMYNSFVSQHSMTKSKAEKVHEQSVFSKDLKSETSSVIIESELDNNQNEVDGEVISHSEHDKNEQGKSSINEQAKGSDMDCFGPLRESITKSEKEKEEVHKPIASQLDEQTEAKSLSASKDKNES